MQTAIITGGSGGIGFAAAAAMGRDHRVVISSRNPSTLREAADRLDDLGVEVSSFACDVADRESVRRLFAHARRQGEVRAVIHAAGLSPAMGSAAALIGTNALGTVHVTEASLELAHDGFALINVASIAAHLLPRVLLPGRTYRRALGDVDVFGKALLAHTRRIPKRGQPFLAYFVSKAFVVWYSRQMAARFGQRGARILSVSPGTFDTTMGRLEMANGSERMVHFSALRRMGEPEEIGELLSFCASTRASYLTGADILCDGGNLAGLSLKNLIAMNRRARGTTAATPHSPRCGA